MKKVQILICFFLIFVSKNILEYMKLVRLPGWGGYCIPAVFGALSVGMFHVWTFILLFIIGILVTVYGFVLNDYIDVAIDKQSQDISERPLVKGSISRVSALRLSIGSIVLAYIILLLAMVYSIFILNVITIGVFSVAVVFAAIYNIYGKKYVGLDIFVAGATAVYCLFGAMAVSSTLSLLTWIIVVVTFMQVLYLNIIIGGVKDADHDDTLGGTTLALSLGVQVINQQVIIPFSFKLIAIGFRLISLFSLFLPFLIIPDFSYYVWQPILMAIMFFGVFYLTILFVNIPQFSRERMRTLISLQVFLRYGIVPVMLFAEIGYGIGLLLLSFPFLWYIIWNQILYGSLTKPSTL